MGSLSKTAPINGFIHEIRQLVIVLEYLSELGAIQIDATSKNRPYKIRRRGKIRRQYNETHNKTAWQD